jgi:hypothetical protein
MVGKKMEDLGAHGSFFCPPFFCHFKCTTDISVDVNMPFNVNAFQGDQNVVVYWIPVARTLALTGPPETRSPLANRAIGGFVCIALSFADLVIGFDLAVDRDAPVVREPSREFMTLGTAHRMLAERNVKHLIVLASRTRYRFKGKFNWR